MSMPRLNTDTPAAVLQTLNNDGAVLPPRTTCDVFSRTDDPMKAPDKPTVITIDFERGDPGAIDGDKLSPASLLKRLNASPAARPTYAAPATPTSSQRGGMPWKIGQAVVHAKFGQGVVVNYEGNADDLRVQVNFGREGLKWLALEYAKLEAV